MNISNKYRCRRAASTCVGVAVALAVGASMLSPASSAAAATANPLSQLKEQSFTLYDSSVTGSAAPHAWALETGIWSRLKLNVDLQFQGAISNADTAAGHDVLVGAYGTTGMFPGSAAGHSQRVVWALTTGNANLSIDVKANGPIKNIYDLGGQSVGVLGANGATYGSAAALSAYIVKKKKVQPIKIVVEPNSAALIAAVSSGQIAAGCAAGAFGQAEASGVTKNILQPYSKLAETISGGNIVGVAGFGLDSQLKAHKSELVPLIAGLRIADEQIEKASNKRIAQVMAKYSAWAPAAISQPALISEVVASRPFFPQDEGYISEAEWTQSLKAFALWGLNIGGTPIDLQSSTFSYKNAVDMSYWNDATPLVNAYFKKYGGGS